MRWIIVGATTTGVVGSAVADSPLLLVRGIADRVPISEASRPLRPAPVARDVHITSDPGVALAGTLHTPAGRGPFPVAIFFAGTGPWPRGGYRLLSDRLVAKGIATLDYDKRGIGQSTGAFLDSLPVIKRDAAAAVAWLRTRSNIDSRRIALVGLSQGATVSAALASRDPKIAAVVMLSGPVGPRADFILDGLRDKLSAAGMSAPAVKRVADALRMLMEAHARGADAVAAASLRAAMVESFVAGGFTRPQAECSVTLLDSPAGRSLYDAARDEATRRIRAPVLAVYGDRDDIIPVRRVVPAARAALAANPDATVIELPGLDHALMHAPPGFDGTRPFPATEVVDLVATWLGQRLAQEKPAAGVR